MSAIPQADVEPDQQMTARGWALLLVMCGAIFLEGIDVSMLNVAVPAIADDVGLSIGSAHWVISAYVLGYAGFMLLGGRSADLLGRRRVFLLSMALFVAFSGVGGVATEEWVLIVARFATGVAAGFMTPAGFSIITSSFSEGTLRNRALAIYGGVGAGGFVLGMVAGGVLTTVNWRWVFFAPMVLGALLLLAGFSLIRRDDHPPRLHGFDVGGAVTVTGAMITAIYALVSFGEDGNAATGFIALAIAVVLAASFVAIELRAREPLISPSLLTSGLLGLTSIVGLLFMAAFFGFQFTITLYLQDLRGWSPLETGLTFAVMGADVVIAPLVAPKLAARYGNPRVMVAGVASAVAAFALALRLGPTWSYLDLRPSLLLVAVAFALVYGPLTAAATEGLADEDHGAAGGVVFTAFQFGGALGLAISTIVLVGGHGDSALTSDYQRALLVPAIFALLALVIGVAGVRRRGTILAR